jgi:hypothetical protein
LWNLLCGKNVLNYLLLIDPSLINMVVTDSIHHPNIHLHPVEHCDGMTCFAASIDDVFISGDTRKPIKHEDSTLVLHEVCFGDKYPGMVHTHFDQLVEEIPEELRYKYCLYHYGNDDVAKYEQMVVDNGFMLLKPGYLFIERK